MTDQNKLNVAIFSGGRGTASITDMILKHPEIELNILVNAYDDGLSTGALRRFIPGMLGPSDIRKNIGRLMPRIGRDIKALCFLLDYRLPDTFSFDQGLGFLTSLATGSFSIDHIKIKNALLDLNLRQFQYIQKYAQLFLDYTSTQQDKNILFEFEDCSIGNIFFAGCFLANNRDFNKTIQDFSEFCEIRGKVYNVTDGENLVLFGVKEDGALLLDESAIVSPQNDIPVKEIFLRSNYLTEAEVQNLAQCNADEITTYLCSTSVMPTISKQAKYVLENADLIIYGPGTQHSSLFPSYLTIGVAEAISSNKSAEKAFISNILKDHEIKAETASSLSRKLLFYLTRKEDIDIHWKNIVTRFLMQTGKLEEDGDYLEFHQEDFPFPLSQVSLMNWEKGTGYHSGGHVLEELFSLINKNKNRQLASVPYQVSIIVPGLNEEKTLTKVLRDLRALSFEQLELEIEIIYVDGGSSDQSIELARQEEGVSVYTLKPGSGRGEALRRGMEEATGDMVVFFPSDGEYEAIDLLKLIGYLAKQEFDVVFGSRSIKCVDINDRLLEIYQGNRMLLLVSKYGGYLLSVLSLFLYNRFISDPLTGIKAFRRKLVAGLDLQSKGIDLETELIAKIAKEGKFILEVPVSYHPRTREEGKKTTIYDGLRAIIPLIKYKFV